MKTRSLFLLTLLIVLISSCAQDEMLEKRRLSMISSQDVTFNASFDEESTESRTFIEEDAETSKLYLRWTKGDEISIFRGTTLNQRFQFKGETGDNSGSFKLVPSDDFVSSNELEESRNYAFYPYDENNKISEKGELAVTLPATQTYAENSFGPGANTMIALTKNTGDVDLKFKNIGGYFKFKFYGDDLTIKSVTLKGNNGEKLAGKAGIACQYGDAPIVTMAEEATETLTLNCGAGIKVGATKEEATEFWFVLPPTKFTKGFTITVTDTDDGTFTKTTEKVFEIKRNTIKPISAMKVETVVDWEAIYAKERAALIDLYNATGGDNWKNNTNWCSDKPVSEWYGVTIRENRIYGLDLYSNNLIGYLPENIGNLTALVGLDLSKNELNGKIPESIGNLTKLVNLGLGLNQFTEIPETIGNLVALRFLYIYTNPFKCVIPESICKLTALQTLSFGGCQLKGNIPDNIENLISLESLDLSYNELSGSIPESIGNLSKLRIIRLNDNKLTGIPESIGNMASLESLDLSDNELSGSIPESIGNCTSLSYIDFQNNTLTGSIPESIGKLESLSSLILLNNQLSGSIPESIGNLKYLTILNLIGNSLSGELPQSIVNLTKLKELYLYGFDLTGSIPEDIGNLKELTTLNLGRNQLSGNIPESIGNLTKLTSLNLGCNQLSGNIPESIGNLTKLTSLNLSENQLSGELPESIGNLSSLKTLNLAHPSREKNSFTGNIPESIGNLNKLKDLDLSNFRLTGIIPESIGNLTNLTRLSLASNLLTGSIPESISNLTKLTNLALSRNQLTGNIPENIGNLPNLTYLGLSNNNFIGNVPSSIVNNNSLWNNCWNAILSGNSNLNLTGITIPVPDLLITDKNGNSITSDEEYAQNKLTILYQWATWCGYSKNFNKTLNLLYRKYKEYGLEIISDQFGGGTSENEIEWEKRVSKGNIFNTDHIFPAMIVVNNDKQVVFSSVFDNYTNLASFVVDYFDSNSDNLYTSTDYSKDGEVVTLQEATIGKGINLTFLGEAFVDKDMETGGLYEQKMKEAMEDLFSMEPYKSMRNRFNVYAVKVVSPNAEFTEGAVHRINDDNSICFEYAQKIPNSDLNPPMVTVVYNTLYNVGRNHCSMYGDGSFVSDIMDIAYGIILHETGGHGIGRLLDEYVESGYESLTLPKWEQKVLDNVWSQYGRGANVDWRSDASTVKWSHFLNDDRYADEGLGLYEGAYLYGYGAYRPSVNSMMRYNDSPFNAPSREQIWKRIMQMSEGEDWTYDYEEFVKYDAINRNAASRSTSRTLTEAERREYIKNHQPPTFINGTWRDAMKNGKSNVVVPLR